MKNHTVPRFYLKQFSDENSGPAHVMAMQQLGPRVIWRAHAVKGIGYEQDFYVHSNTKGQRTSIEDNLATLIESPFTQSETWAKIREGCTKDLDRSDRTNLIGLMRHMEVRSPHFRRTARELADLAVSRSPDAQFSDDERRRFTLRKQHPDFAELEMSYLALRPLDSYETSRTLLTIAHSEQRLRTSTVPCISLDAPSDPRLDLPLVGMVPYQRVLPLNQNCVALLIEGDFNSAMSHIDMQEDEVRGLNRQILTHFLHFPSVRNLICDDVQLEDDMLWAGYSLTMKSERKIVFSKSP